jgi:hypothetical protein
MLKHRIITHRIIAHRIIAHRIIFTWYFAQKNAKICSWLKHFFREFSSLTKTPTIIICSLLCSVTRLGDILKIQSLFLTPFSRIFNHMFFFSLVALNILWLFLLRLRFALLQKIMAPTASRYCCSKRAFAHLSTWSRMSTSYSDNQAGKAGANFVKTITKYIREFFFCVSFLTKVFFWQNMFE